MLWGGKERVDYQRKCPKGEMLSDLEGSMSAARKEERGKEGSGMCTGPIR